LVIIKTTMKIEVEKEWFTVNNCAWRTSELLKFTSPKEIMF